MGFVPNSTENGSAPLDISSWRKTYLNKEEPFLAEERMKNEPFEQFDVWFKDVSSRNLSFEETNAVNLSTCTNNRPSSRMLLLKKYDANGFQFYTNYNSRKGRELLENPHASMLFYWPAVTRQVRIEGVVEKLPVTDANEYWASRPLASRIGSKASLQSTVVASRTVLDQERERLEKLAETQGEAAITRPELWAGFVLKPTYFEFWQGQSNRLHDRIIYELDSASGKWEKKRLSP